MDSKLRENIKENLKEGFEQVKDKLKDDAQYVRDTLKEDVNRAKDSIKDDVNMVKDRLKEDMKQVKQALSDFQHEVNAGVLVLFAVAGVWLNVLLITKTIYKKKLDLLIINLAIANICLCVINNPLAAVSSYQHKWAWGDNMCTYYGVTGLLFGFVMMTTVAMIVIDEYLLYDWAPYINKRAKVNKIMITYIWLNTAFWSLTPLFGWSSIGYEPYGTSCTVTYRPNEGYASYIICCFLACYIVPILVIYFCKSRYVGTVRVSRTTDRALNLSKRSMMLLLTFLVCWTPYSIVYIWPIVTRTSEISVAFASLAPLFAKLSTVLTPMVLLYYQEEEIVVIPRKTE